MSISLLIFLALGQPTPPTPKELFKDHRWKNRVIVMHSPAALPPWLVEQQRALERSTLGNKDRDLVLYTCARGRCRRMEADGWKAIDVPASAMARDLHVDRPTILLIGKDGGVKLRVHRFKPVADIYRTIDAMPMRRLEMRADPRE